MRAATRFPADTYKAIACSDAAELTEHAREWHFDFTQLRAGDFTAAGGMIELDSAVVAKVTLDQSLMHRGYAPHGSTSILIPGHGSDPAFVGSHELSSAQCISLAGGGCLEAITRGRYVDVALAVEADLWETQSHWLGESSLATARGMRIENPGPQWINRMLGAVDWIFAATEQHPEALARADVRTSLRDQLLLGLTGFEEQDLTPHQTRGARARQRLAVERALQYIREKLSEPLRLSELCSHAHVQARALEYGFREITGLSPIAYIKSLRLKSVRMTLLLGRATGRSISEIALDHGFWHLSQFAVDYRKFFGESPSMTLQRARRRATPAGTGLTGAVSLPG